MDESHGRSFVSVIGSLMKISEFGKETYSKAAPRSQNKRRNLKNHRRFATKSSSHVWNTFWWDLVEPNSIKNRNKNISNRLKNIIIGLDYSYSWVYKNLRRIILYNGYRKGKSTKINLVFSKDFSCRKYCSNQRVLVTRISTIEFQKSNRGAWKS